MNRLNIKTKLFYGVAIVGFISIAMAHFGQTSTLAYSKEEKNNASREVEEAKKVQLQEAYGKLPLSFIRNEGQMDKKVKFYEKENGQTTYFTQEGVYLNLSNDPRPKVGALTSTGLRLEVNVAEPKSTLLKLIPLGADKHSQIFATGLQEGKINYFLGQDPKGWKTNLPTYQAVVYKELYPGIDMKFYGNNRQMEYDIVIKPGADPSKVRLAYEGIRGLIITEDGDLEIKLKAGKIIQKKPKIYQEVDGKQVKVAGKFKLLNHHLGYRFEVASYDKTLPLIIDPTLVYSTFLGGSGFDLGAGIVLDTAGNAYIVGSTSSINFPTTLGAYQTTFPGKNCSAGGSSSGPCFTVFLTKLNSTGSALIYSTYLGGSGDDAGNGIAVDTAGNAYVTGLTSSINFPTTPGTFQSTYPGGNCSSMNGWSGPNCQHAFLSKLDSTGTGLVYSTYLGGSAADQSNGIAVDTAGNAYVTGNSSSINFPTTPGAFQPTYPGVTCPSFVFLTSPYCQSTFVTILNSTGSALIYSTYLSGGGYGGGSGESGSFGQGIAVDTAGNAYVTGYTSSTNFPTTSGAFQTVFTGHGDAFVAKINPLVTGSASLVYSTLLGGDTFAFRIALDTSGNAYVTGNTFSINFPTTSGAYQTANAGNTNAFVAEINPSASGTASLVYSTYLGGNGNNTGYGIVLDTVGNVYLTGLTSSTNFPTTPGAYQTVLGGSYNAFVAKINPSASGTASLIYSTYLGGSGGDQGLGIALDVPGNVYVMGLTSSTNFPTTPGAYQTAYASGSSGGNVFITKISTTLNQAISFGVLGNKTYGDLPFTVSATGGASGNFVTFTAGPAGVCTSSGTNGSTVTIVGAGGCTVTAHQAGNSNYNAAPDVPQSFTIMKATLTVTADNKANLLNAPLPPLTATMTGFKNGETLSTSGVTGSPNLATTATAISPVGSYPITAAVGTLASSNYSFTFGNGTLIIQYATSGLCGGDVGHAILQPINVDGTSVFKQTSTVPAKFRVCDANGVSIGTPGVVASFLLIQIVSGTVVDTVDEAVDSTTPDASFRWDSTGQQWIFNISTKSLSAKTTYFYQVTLNDGSTINFKFGLR